MLIRSLAIATSALALAGTVHAGDHGDTAMKDKSAEAETRAEATTTQAELKPMAFDEDAIAPKRLASTWMGLPVHHGDSQDTVGEVSDIVFDTDYQIKRIVVDAGGLLELNETRVALPLHAFDVSVTDDEPRLSVSMSEEELEALGGESEDGNIWDEETSYE